MRSNEIAVVLNFVGYSISYNDLTSKNSSELDAIKDKSSFKRLLNRLAGNETLSSLLYGPHSFGAYLEDEVLTINGVDEAITAVPSPTNASPYPNKKDFFAATTSPSVNDHLGKVDAFQAEIHKYYRDHDEYLVKGANNKTIREPYQDEYAKAFGNAVIKFFAKFYGEYWQLFLLSFKNISWWKSKKEYVGLFPISSPKVQPVLINCAFFQTRNCSLQ